MIRKRIFKMSELLLCSRTLTPSALQTQCGINIDQLSTFNCPTPSIAAANTPYLINNQNNNTNFKILNQLSPPPIAREITNLSLSYGSDNMLALAEITAKIKEFNIGLVGASTAVYGERVKGFTGAVLNYQTSLLDYRSAVTSHSSSKVAAKQNVYGAFQKMQSQFQHELNAVTSQAKARRGNPLSNVKRATDIAQSSRSATKLNVTSQIQANNLVRFANHAKYLGNGLAIIDFGSRVGNIHNSYQTNGNWEREMFIESSSFAASAMTGTIAVNAGLSLLIFATPFGWAGLIIGGIAVAGVAAAGSIGINSIIQNNAGNAYDLLMNWIK
jgi:hypothetical protein